MRICLDLSAAVHRRAGLGRYAQELATALLALDHDNEYIAFYNDPSGVLIEPPVDRLPKAMVDLPSKPWRLSVLLSYLLRASQDRLFPDVDIFHATDHLLPRLACARSVLTLHDVTYHLYPQTHAVLNRWFLALMMPRFLRAATAVIADSHSTRRDAARLYRLDESRIRVIHAGVSARFQPAKLDAVRAIRQKYGLPERFVLYVGTIEPRKNLTTLLDAYRLFTDREPGCGLVIAGKKGWRCSTFFRRLQELGLEGQVIFAGFVPDEDLAALYSAADLFAFPSLYEGFGLPILEAMACGTPVLCSGTSSLPEVAGDAAILLDPHDISAWVEAMVRLVRDDALRTGLRARGLARAARFSWEACARATLEVYRSLQAPTHRDRPASNTS